MKARVRLKIRAGAPRTGFAGRYGEGWKLAVAAPPVDGRANEAIVKYVAGVAGVAARAVRIVTGHTGTSKLVEVEGISAGALERAILGSHGPRGNTGGAAAPES